MIRTDNETAALGTSSSARLAGMTRAGISLVGKSIELLLLVLLAAALLGDAGVVLLNILERTFFGRSLLWLDEVSTLALVVLAFFGGAVAYRRDALPSIHILSGRLPSRLKEYQYALADWLVLGGSAWLAVASIPYLQLSWAQPTIMLGISSGWSVLPVTVGTAVISFFALERLVCADWRVVGLSLLPAGVAALVIEATHQSWDGALTGGSALALSMLLFGVLAVVGVPIPLVFAFGAMIYLYLPGRLPTVSAPLNMQLTLQSFLLVAIPFFIFAGFVMDRGGATLRIIAFFRTLLGHLRGGLLLVEIAAMYVFSGISGSKTADVAAVGSSMTSGIQSEGYEAEESAAVLAASAAMGETIPPSIAMLVLGSISTLSVGTLFLAGLLPAAILAVALMAGVTLRARRNAFGGGKRANIKDVMRSGLGAVFPALTIVILFVGIVGGVATPTDTSALAVLYALILSVFIYRELSVRRLAVVIRETCVLTGMVLFMVAAAGAFSWVLTANNVPQRVATEMKDLPGGAPVFMLVSIAGLIISGMLFEGLPALLVLAPILLPVAAALGINLLTYGLVLIIAMGIGAFAPPLGVGFFVACSVSGASPERSTARALGYFGILVVGLVLIAFVPWFTTLIPNLTGSN